MKSTISMVSCDVGILNQLVCCVLAMRDQSFTNPLKNYNRYNLLDIIRYSLSRLPAGEAGKQKFKNKYTAIAVWLVRIFRTIFDHG